MATEARTRVRKPDAETAAEENIVAEENVTVTEETSSIAEALDIMQPVAPEVQPTPLKGPFTRNGFHIVDATGRSILMAGVEGDIVKTGPGIAEAVLAYLNKEFVEAGRM